MNPLNYCMKVNKMRKSYLLNGKKVLNKQQLHDYLCQVFKLPEYYGRNLDALWDCLSTNNSIKKITVIHTENLVAVLGDYGALLLRLFNDLNKSKSIEVFLFAKGRKDETN